MSDDGIMVGPRPLPLASARVEITRTPEFDEAAKWSSHDPFIPRWPLWFIPFATIALAVVSLAPVSPFLMPVLRQIGIPNALWLLGAFLPVCAFFWIASTRLDRHAVAANRMLRSAYYIAWSSVSSWKPDVRDAGLGTLVKLDGRKKEMGETLRHLKWGLWGFALFCLSIAGGVYLAEHDKLIDFAHELRGMLLAVAVATATLVLARRIASHTRTLGPSDAEIRRATDLHHQCNDERERWRRSPFG